MNDIKTLKENNKEHPNESPMVSSNRTFKIYPISKYSSWTKNKIESGGEQYNFEELLDKLKYDSGYHIRISKGGTYIYFGDCDGYDKPF